MDQNRKLYLTSLGLAILMVTLIFADLHSGHIEKSYWIVVLALAFGVAAFGIDLWRRTTPGSFKPIIDTRENPVAIGVSFVGAMLVLGYFVIRDAFFTRHSQFGHPRSPVFILSWLVGYNLLVMLVRYLRSRKLKSTIT